MPSSGPQSNSFPRPFTYQRIFRERTDDLDNAPFLVAAMLTGDFSDYGSRLAQSCEDHGLQYALYDVPTVHRSISPKGSDDPAYTKANFIHYLLDEYDKPVLYVDVDCVIRAAPQKIEDIARAGYDFAIYNWLAEEHTEFYEPVEVKLSEDGRIKKYPRRFFKFAHSLDYYAEDQLVCSGAVQFYNDTEAARELLRNWQRVILIYPNSADDLCLNFAFNNFPPGTERPNGAWLPKAYARYAWWIYEQPVIDHPDFPTRVSRPVPGGPDAKYFYPDRTELQSVDYYFPKDCLIDTEKNVLVKVEDGHMTPWQPFTRTLWL